MVVQAPWWVKGVAVAVVLAGAAAYVVLTRRDPDDPATDPDADPEQPAEETRP